MSTQRHANKSVMKHQFSEVPKIAIQRSSFDRSHGYKTAFDSGYLVPVFIDEALPGDTFNINMTGFARMATPIVPVMDNMRMDTQFFAVPYRLLWENWERFNGEQDNPTDSTDYLVPTMTSPAGGYDIGTLSDYFGLPTEVADLEHSALFHRAYNLIYNQWYRDENLQESVPFNKGDGPDDPADYQLLRRGKRADYFTSCLPWPQKGESVSLPLGTEAPVTGIGKVQNIFGLNGRDVYETDGIGTVTYPTSEQIQGSSPGETLIEEDPNNPGFPNIRADLSEATAATINELRQSFQIQRLLERDARGGTRYTELVLSHFGVTSPDARLQRAEYLGGGTSPIIINPVAQTSQTDDQGPGTPQGTLAATATATMVGHGFTKSFTEHCIIIGLVSVRADLTYQQGLNRMWSRQTRYDFYWPVLAHIGEQAVLNKEIYAQGTPADDQVFGYQERYAEYRYKPSQITGILRSTAAQSLDVWHLSQEFESLPELGPDFIQENPPVDRVIAVPSEPQFIFDSYFSYRCARPMPLYGVPGLIDHF